MRNGMLTSLLALSLVACGSPSEGDDTITSDDTSAATPTQTLDNATVSGDQQTQPTSAGSNTVNTPPTAGEPSDPQDPQTPATPPSDPGPKPTATCTVSKDANGFFNRSNYVGFVPTSYDGSKPVRLLVGLHGCGDNAKNFATWATAPYDTRKTQQHIAISIGGRDGTCWQNGDENAVLAAIADISSCFWVNQKQIVIGGFSSGGELGYRVAMKHADKIAGLVVEDSGFYGSSDEATLLSSAKRKFNIAHIAHQSDSVFPLSSVQADWTRIKNAGFPMTTSVVAGAHDGTSADWNTFLIPHMANMTLP